MPVTTDTRYHESANGLVTEIRWSNDRETIDTTTDTALLVVPVEAAGSSPAGYMALGLGTRRELVRMAACVVAIILTEGGDDALAEFQQRVGELMVAAGGAMAQATTSFGPLAPPTGPVS